MNGFQLAQQGMQLTLSLEPEAWVESALEGLKTYGALPGRQEFTIEVFRAWWLARGNPSPHSHKCWGALANTASRRGLIAHTGKFVRAVSPKTHAHWVPLWRLSFLSETSSPAQSDYRIHADGQLGLSQSASADGV